MSLRKGFGVVLHVVGQEQALAAFYLCLKTYRLVLDLHMELGVKKYRMEATKAYDVALFRGLRS